MMLEDPVLGPLMVLPRPGLKQTAEEVAAGLPEGPPRKPTIDDDCRNIHESVGWWEKIEEERTPGWKQGEHGIVLSLNVDGVQPFDRGQRTVTPIVCMIQNLPENLRHRAEYLLLAGLIPNSEPKNLNPFMEVLVNELLVLWKDGITFTEPKSRHPRVARVMLLFTACDYPAHCHLNLQRGQSSQYGCHKCDVPVGLHKGLGRDRHSITCIV
jgi:hypothetical protein